MVRYLLCSKALGLSLASIPEDMDINAEANSISKDNVEPMHLNITDFIKLFEGNIDQLVDDESVIV